MPDSYPEIINFEINRTQLERYMNRMNLYLISILFLFLGLFVGLANTAGAIDDQHFKSKDEFYLFLIGRTGLWIAVTILAIVCFQALTRRYSKRYAESLNVSVEGAFLRIREYSNSSLSDRKIHFRSIVDYTIIETPMRNRYGIQTLKMNTTSGGQYSAIVITGIEDCARVRDILSDIDQLRENS